MTITTNAVATTALPLVVPAPANNPITKEKVELGKKLFFDPRLSWDGTVSCNSCHNVMAGGDDNRPTSAGVGGRHGGRSAPTVWNAAFLSVQFWDGRAATLEDQAKGPLINPVEMAMPSHDAVVARIQAIPGYVEEFRTAFKLAAKESAVITIDRVAMAIATYERTLVTRGSRFDRFVSGDKKALTADEARGYKLVQDNGCISCHSGPMFSGPALPTGVGFYQKFPLIAGSTYDAKYKLTEDLGRFNVTKQDADKNTWRVPTWRNVAVTAPYFHNGAVATLDEAVRVMGKTQLGKDLPQGDVDAIVAFLKTLTGEFPSQSMPRLPLSKGISATDGVSVDIIKK